MPIADIRVGISPDLDSKTFRKLNNVLDTLVFSGAAENIGTAEYYGREVEKKCIASENASKPDFERMALGALACDKNPSPLPILEELERNGMINASEMIGFDSISCFRIDGELTIAGLPVDSVCAHEEDETIRAKRPDLLFRGPGTSPGQFISFGTAASDDVVTQWYLRTIGMRHLNKAVESKWTNMGDRTEVECSSWFSG